MTESIDIAVVLDRVQDLESARDLDRAELADLKARDQRREAEHREVLRAYEDIATGRDALRREIDLDYQLLGQAFDQRIGELVQSNNGGGVSNAMLIEAVRIIVAAMQQTSDRQKQYIDALVLNAVKATFEASAKHTATAIDRLLDSLA